MLNASLLDDPWIDGRRIRIFVLVQLVALVLIYATVMAVGSGGQRYAANIACLAIGLMLGVTYGLRAKPYAELLVYANLAVIVTMLALLGPLSGTIDGSAWVLFQIPPLIATIVIDRLRATLLMVGLAALSLVVVGGGAFAGIIPVAIVIEPGNLLFNLINQLITLAVVALTVAVLVGRATRALGLAERSHAEVAAQLEAQRRLTAEQAAANVALKASLDALAERDEQLRAEAREQARLRLMIAEMSTPVIPIVRGVVAMPLVGSLDGERARELGATLLAGIERHRARIAIIDVTAIAAIDTHIGAVLIRAAEACGLIGATPVLSGLRPEVAQTLVSLGIDLSRFRTARDMEAAVAWALGAR